MAKTTTKKTTEKKPVKAVAMEKKARKPSALDQRVRKLELYGTANVDAWLVELSDRLDRIERLLSTPQDVTSGTVEIKPIISEEQGLQAGDYTDASKEVADALTAMGWLWVDGDRFNLPIITWHSDPKYALYGKLVCTTGNQDNPLPHPEFLSRAAVTAKALGLVPVEPKPWKPEVGELVVCECNDFPDTCPRGTVGPVIRLYENGAIDMVGLNGKSRHMYAKERRKPTQQEVAKYHADIEAAKPIVPYVTRVMHEGKERVVLHGPDPAGDYELHHANKAGYTDSVWAKRDEFTVLP